MPKFYELTNEERLAWTLRFLSVDMIQQANSGHPGLPLGAADFVSVLWQKFLRFDPLAPDWPGRDRFVLSAGHGSALLYSLLHLYGFDVPMEQMKRFRQLGSITPGHPEYGLTPGVETTTGPLGQGLANAVGMALASKMLHARLRGADGWSPADYRVFALVGDGCLMEGISHEVASLAGHLELDNLFVLYDMNFISIEGSTDLTFTEDVPIRFEAYGWRVMYADGHNRDEIAEVLANALEHNPCDIDAADEEKPERPTLICFRTYIGYGSQRQDMAKAHGEPLGSEDITRMKTKRNWPQEPFFVPEDVRELCRTRIGQLNAERSEWERASAQWKRKHPDLHYSMQTLRHREFTVNPLHFLVKAVGSKNLATRAHSCAAIQAVAKISPELIGGSADLTPSNKTWISDSAAIEPGKFGERNIHFGVREHGMGGIMNGMALSGLIPFGGTFLVFADYMKPAIRMAAIMKLGVIYVFTHDSIGVGEDGPTHQPVEQLAMLRAIPGLVVYRPADGPETAAAWTIALKRAKTGCGPTALVLSRQELPNLERPDVFDISQMLCGGYVIRHATRPRPRQPVIVATGSEVALALEVASTLDDGMADARVVSMPSREVFLTQDLRYQEEVIPPDSQVAVIEASLDDGWYKITKGGPVIGMDEFGASAPAQKLAERFAFTKDGLLTLLAGWPEPSYMK